MPSSPTSVCWSAPSSLSSIAVTETVITRPPSAQVHAGGVDHHPPEPGIEPVGVAQLRQCLPGLDEGLLGHVVGIVRVPDDRLDQAVGRPETRQDDGVVGVDVTTPSAFDEPLLVEQGRPWCSIAIRACMRVGPSAEGSRMQSFYHDLMRAWARRFGSVGVPGGNPGRDRRRRLRRRLRFERGCPEPAGQAGPGRR